MVEIEQKLYNDIKEYCKLNHLVIKDFVNKLLRKAFTIEKYGEKPFMVEPTNKVKENYFENKTEKKVFGEVKIPNEVPYNNVVVSPTDIQPKTTAVVNNEEPIVEKKSKKRKL